MRTVRIFISSPGDVLEEREKAREIIEQLHKRYAGQLELQPVLWEDLPLSLDASFQAGIDTILSASQGIDIAVFMIWSRLGSPVGRAVSRPDGSTYRSGTERELDLMLSARKASGGIRPAMLAYLRDDAEAFQERFRGKDTDGIRQMVEQKQLAENFIREQFQDAATGTNVRAYHTYDKPIEYAHRLRVHLQGLLDEMVQQQPGVIRWEGPPFRGLEAFGVEHASIFCGRDVEVADVLLTLHNRAAEGCGAVVIAGASGSGKSSLVRAGVIPALVDQNLDSATATWRYSIFRPGNSATDLLGGLAREIASPTALPNLRERLDKLEDLATALAASPESAFRLTLAPALKAFDQLEKPARLLIVVDQLEELFTHAAGRRESIAEFFHTLRVLCQTDRIQLIATVRSDFYAQCQEYDELLILKQGVGLYDLRPPRPAELLQMITRPAAMAGLRFETDARTGRSLDRRILDEASEQPDALPLLQYTLRELFEKRSADGVLKTAQYEELNGVVGALSRRAEQVFLALSQESQQSLGSVLNELVTVSEADNGVVARQQASRESVSNSQPQRELVDCFIQERLLVSDRGTDDRPVVSVAHESLLRAWSRAAEWIETNRQFLASRARVQQDLERWQREDRSKDFLIPSGKPLEDARALLTMGRQRLNAEQRKYIETSSAYHQGRQQRQLQRSRIASLVFLILAIIACGVGLIAFHTERVATGLNTQLSGLNTQMSGQLYDNRIAVAERELGMNQDRDLASDLLEQCPQQLRGWEWNYLMAQRDGSREPLADHKRGIWTAVFSPDGKRVVTASIDGTAKIWDADTGKVIRTFSDHNEIVLNLRKLPFVSKLPDVLVKAAVFSPDGQFVASASITPVLTHPTFRNPVPKVDIVNSRGTVLIWNANTGKVVQRFDGQLGVSLALAYSPDGNRIASSSMNADHTFVVWEVATGHVVKVVHGHTGHVYTLCYSHDGRRLITGGIDGTVKIWDANTLALIHSIDAHPAPVMCVTYSPDDAQLATAGQDGSVRIWDANSYKLLNEMRGHTGSALSVAYTPDGTRIASGGFDRTVRIWDPKTAQLKITLRGHRDSVWSVAFSPDGQRLVSGSYDNDARIWDATPPIPLNQPGIFSLLGHTERVNNVTFSPDKRWLATSSWDNTIRLWDAQTGAPSAILTGHTGAVWGIAFSPDSTKLASAGWDQTVRVWDVATASQIISFADNASEVQDVAFDSDGGRVISSAWDGTVTVWDIKAKKAARRIAVSFFPVLGIDVHDNRVACGAGDRTISIWNINSGEKLMSIEDAHTATVYGVAFSHDGKRLVSGGWDGLAKVWSVDPAVPLASAYQKPLTLHSWPDEDENHYRLYRVAFSPDDSKIATSGDDKSVRIWNATTGVLSQPPINHRGVVWAVAFSPDGQRVAASAWTKSAWVRTWNVVP